MYEGGICRVPLSAFKLPQHLNDFITAQDAQVSSALPETRVHSIPALRNQRPAMGSETRPPEPEITYFDRNGDTRLLLDPENEPRVFVVSYKAVSAVCDAWDRMLSPDGPFKEANQDGSVSLSDDDPEGLTIILNIAHLHFNRVPHRLNFRKLLSVAVLTEKYGTTKIVRPWYRGWMKGTRKLAKRAGYEEWLWIAWAFGEDDTFERVAKSLVMKVSVDEQGQCVNARGKVLDSLSDESHFPPGIIDTRPRFPIICLS